MLTFDHQKLVDRNPRELKRLRRFLLAIQPGDVLCDVFVLHERDDSCCKAEPWNATMLALFAAINPPARVALFDVPTGRPGCN
jgi:hypothetical protein